MVSLPEKEKLMMTRETSEVKEKFDRCLNILELKKKVKFVAKVIMGIQRGTGREGR